MDAISAASGHHDDQAESPSPNHNAMRAMASTSQPSHPSHSRAGASPTRIAGLRSLHALAGQSPSTTEPDRFPQEPNADMIITRLLPKKQPLVLTENNNESISDEMSQPIPVESSAKADKPTLPENFSRLTPKAKLKAVKQFLSAFEYKQTPATHFNSHKLRPLTRIMDTARMIIYSPQPIKCVEAVFLALYLTAGIPDCERIPLGFKTSLRGQVFQHIVLLIQYGGKFGAFGISRQADLMNKDLTFDCMSDVVENYKDAYEAAGHKVIKIRVGLPVEHKIQSPNYVCWRHLSLNLGSLSWEECRAGLENHSNKKKRLWDLWLLAGKGGDPKRKSLVRKATLDTKTLVNEAMKKKKKVKMQYTTIRALAEAEQVKSELHESPGREPVTSAREEAKASKERKRGLHLAATKSMMKTRLLQPKTTFLIRERALQLRKLNMASGPRVTSQTKRISRVSFDIDNLKQNLVDMKFKGRGQEAGGIRLPKGKEQASTGVHSKGNLGR